MGKRSGSQPNSGSIGDLPSPSTAPRTTEIHGVRITSLGVDRETEELVTDAITALPRSTAEIIAESVNGKSMQLLLAGDEAAAETLMPDHKFPPKSQIHGEIAFQKNAAIAYGRADRSGVAYTAMHELGHKYDYYGGYSFSSPLSADPKFTEAVKADLAVIAKSNLPLWHKGNLAKMRYPENLRVSELFADAFAAAAVRRVKTASGAKLLDAVAAQETLTHFPRATQVVEGMLR